MNMNSDLLKLKTSFGIGRMMFIDLMTAACLLSHIGQIAVFAEDKSNLPGFLLFIVVLITMYVFGMIAVPRYSYYDLASLRYPLLPNSSEQNRIYLLKRSIGPFYTMIRFSRYAQSSLPQEGVVYHRPKFRLHPLIYLICFMALVAITQYVFTRHLEFNNKGVLAATLVLSYCTILFACRLAWIKLAICAMVAAGVSYGAITPIPTAFLVSSGMMWPFIVFLSLEKESDKGPGVV